MSLLKLAIWLRKQAWLRPLYGAFPRSWRSGVNQALLAPASKIAPFERTPAWYVTGVDDAASDSMQGGLPPATRVDEGVNILGYFRGQFGLGEAARLYAQALIDQGYPVALSDMELELPHGLDDRSLESRLGGGMPYETHLVCVNPDYLDAALARIHRGESHRPYVIGCWFWELEKIPVGWREAVDKVDEILVASSFVERAFRAFTDKPIHRVALPVGKLVDSGLSRRDFGLPEDRFVFLTSFDFNSGLDRKNPIGAIEAFKLAFPSARRDVTLLVKSSNGHRYPEQFARLVDAASSDPRIMVRDDIIDRPHVRALQRCVDAYVSLHRAEGFGLGLAECMWIGKPVIATNWSGNVDFMDESNSCLVGSRLIPVERGQYPFAEDQHWADPDVAEAARHMARLVDDPAFASRIGSKAAQDACETLSATATARQLIDRLEAIRRERADAPGPSQMRSTDAPASCERKSQ
jgi:glycosyltransferase involved in cell wall biosynthesis